MALVVLALTALWLLAVAVPVAFVLWVTPKLVRAAVESDVRLEKLNNRVKDLEKNPWVQAGKQ